MNRFLKLSLQTLAIILLFSNPGFANNRKLIETLLENEQLTEEQAAELLAEEESNVQPAGKNFKDFRIRGRIQTQAGFVHAKDENGSKNHSTLELRRVFLGVQGTLLQNVRAQIEANLVPGSDFHLRSAFLQWREHPEAFIKVGFDRPVFGFEHTTSSASILTVERSTLTQSIVPKDTVGIALDGEISSFGYGAGIYTNRENANISGEGRYLYNLSGSWNAENFLPENQTLQFRIDLLFNDDRTGLDSGNKPNFIFKNGTAASLHYLWNDFDFRAEFLYANDFDRDAVYGFYLQPAYHLSGKTQLVARYENVKSEAGDGLRSPNRYSRRAIDQNGDRFQALYAGLNYYFSGDSNKLMFGAELSQLETANTGDLDATTLYAAWRVLF